MRSPTTRLTGLLVACGVLLIGPAPGFAEELPPVGTDSDAYKAPPSPAFTALGIAPQEIARPTTPAELAATLVNAWHGSDSTASAPGSFAVEFSPALVFGPVGGSLEDYLDDPLEQSAWENLLVSLARADVPGWDGSSHVSAAVGLHTTLTRSHQEADRRLREFKAARSRGQALEFQVNSFASAGAAATIDSAALTALKDQAKAARDQEKMLGMALKADASDLLADRTGLNLDLAMAAVWRMPAPRAASAGDANVDDSSSTTSGFHFDDLWIWAAPSYSWGHLSLVGLARYAHLGVSTGSKPLDAVDSGGRLDYATDRLVLGAEGVARLLLQDGSYQSLLKYDASAEFRLYDKLWLSLTIGRDWGPWDQDGGTPLLTLANLQWNVGSRSVTSALEPAAQASGVAQQAAWY
jgi:hypothetical protein